MKQVRTKIAKLIIEKMPKSCGECPLFVNKFAMPTYCVMGAEYSNKEIAEEKDGNLSMYYHGCLSKRPISCPLKEEPDEKLG